MFEQTRQYLKKKGIPDADRYDLPTSEKRFSDGAQFRLEVPTVNTPACMKAVLESAEKHGAVVNRIDDTYGVMRHTDKTLIEFTDLAKEWGVELNLSIGPRATYDTSTQRSTGTAEANRIGYRLRGMEQIVRAVEDVKRAVEFGVRGVLVYDEGCLWLLNEMRKDGEIPADIHFKLSAHCGHANPLSAKFLQDFGANSINPIRDLSLPMMAAFREMIDVPLDLHTDNPKSTGGMIRTYEAPEIVRMAAPVYLKAGNSSIGSHGIPTTSEDGTRMGAQAALVLQMVRKHYPEAVQTKKGDSDLRIPK
ncbi:MAG: peptidase [Candidatus Thorarchaeota archaeon]|jgi:hypothetical protein